MSDSQAADDTGYSQILLGEALPESEQAEIEERYFTDDVYFDRLLALEDDLIDSHIRGTLSESETIRFERHFLEFGAAAGRNGRHSGPSRSFFGPGMNGRRPAIPGRTCFGR